MHTVEEIMTRDVVFVHPDTEIGKAADLLLERHINGMPVLDHEGKLVGILCQSDLIVQQKSFPIPSVFTLLDGLLPLTSFRHVEKELSKMAATTVAQAMTPKVVFVSPDTTVEDAATLMVEKKFHTLPVVKDGKLVGVLGKEDVLRTIVG
ncbi:MAG: CBS domain-containing protein [Thermodesulfobacteriota bacterium]